MADKVGDETIRNVNFGAVSVDPLLGQVIEQYRIESVIGTGAMGIVYRGIHQVIGKAAAIKVLKIDFADDPEMVQRLVREARTVNAIRHPAIVDIFGFGTLAKSEQPYIIMDLLEGDPLDQFIKQHAPMRPRQVFAMLDELLSALSSAHAVGVIHRDLKPGNVFVESKPDGKVGIKVIDFGLAKQADRAGGSVKPTNPGTLLGTPAFMAPEQVMGEKVTPVADLYAVGGIAYQMLTNHFPHEGSSAIEVLSQKMAHDPIRPRNWQPTIDEALEAWVLNLLSREPEKRHQTADEARRALKRVMDAARVSNNTPALKPPQNMSRSPSGVIPKRSWGDAKTLITDEVTLNDMGDGSAQASTDSRPVPAQLMKPVDLAETMPENEPTAPPMTSPFQGQSKPPSKRSLQPVTMPAADAEVIAAQEAMRKKEAAINAQLETPAPAPSKKGLIITLAAVVFVLLVALAVLLSKT